MDFEGVKAIVLKKLNEELSVNLYYHCPEHTIDVLESVERFAQMEGVNGHDLILLKTGALFHDLGFIETYDGHEKVSIKLANQILPDFGYSLEDIKKIEGIILSTELPQNPNTHLEKIMADADLDYIGRDDLFLIGQRLQYEWKLIGKISTLRDWHIKQLAFLRNHVFFTQSARKLRDEKKAENIRELERLLCLKK